ncbi:MAG: tRNA (adenosine(37)-N6)-threonylcarbamoyltransferase complex dimerization subunit type 1 TsaB [Myxococcota bacterium]
MKLALTTSTPCFEVALLEDERPLATLGIEGQKRHAEHMFAGIDDVFREAGVTKADVTGVICDIGPGSFTGVRVGLAAAKGIAFGLQVPIWGVTSLRVMANDALRRNSRLEVVAAVIDARRGERFVAAYRRDGEVALAPRTVPNEDLVAALGGHGTPCGDRPDGYPGPWLEGPCRPRAAAMGPVTTGRPPSPLDALAPLYLRDADATPPAVAPDRRVEAMKRRFGPLD